jgi:hypothetical protein
LSVESIRWDPSRFYLLSIRSHDVHQTVHLIEKSEVYVQLCMEYCMFTINQHILQTSAFQFKFNIQVSA